MRSTFFLISMLIFVSATSDIINSVKPDENADTLLLELTKSPAAEAVFATAALQVEQSGGFNRILGLLNELISDTKKRLHEMNMVWRRVNARCVVSRSDLRSRQDFYDNYLAHANLVLRNARNRLSEVNDNLNGYTEAKNVYHRVLTAELARHARGRSYFRKRLSRAAEGLKRLDQAIFIITHWTPRGAALIQTHINAFSQSFLELKGFALPDVSSFVETARTTDPKVRRRLLQWINQVRVLILSASARYKTIFAKYATHADRIENALAGMRAAMVRAISHMQKARVFARNKIRNASKSVSLYTQLVRSNNSLRKSMRLYCNTEQKNYYLAKDGAVAGIKLFIEIRKYFVDNYNRFKSYVKTKYYN